MESVTRKLAAKRKSVSEKVGEIMGGKVVKMEWLEHFDAAVEKGRQEGKEEGLKEGEKERLRLEAENRRLQKELDRLAASAGV